MNNVTVFWGVDHKTGTTMLAQSCAEIMHKDGNNSVLLLTLSENRGDDYFADEAIGLDDIRNRLSCGLMDGKILKEVSATSREINKIHGLSDSKGMFAFTIDIVNELIDCASKTFDKVVIDGGTGLHSPLTLSALTWGGFVVFVTTQQESSIRQMEHLSEGISALGIHSNIVAVNKYIKGDFISPGYIAQRTGIVQNIMKTVTENEFGHQAENDRKTILHYGEKQFEKDVRNLI